MSFLGLAFLLALPLASAPLLLHLFDRQRKVVIEWGAMQFLLEASKRRTSARKLKQWLLLLLRTLAILCLVLALARPLVNAAWLGSTDRSELIVVIDNSLSMTREIDGETLFDSAVRLGIDQMKNAKTGDLARAMLTSPYPIWLAPTSVRLNDESRASIEELLRDRKPTRGSSDLLSAMFAAVQTEPAPSSKRRRVVVLTDGQAADWKTTDRRGWTRLQEVIRSVAIPTELDVINIGSKRANLNNLAINRIDSNRVLIGRNQFVTVTAQIQNHGQESSEPTTIVWTATAEESERMEIPGLEPGSTHDAVWRHSLSALGVQKITAEIDVKDALTVDNRAAVIVDVVELIPVLVVESHAASTEEMQDAFFVQAALGWIDGEPLEDRAVYSPTLVTPEQLGQIELQQYRAVVIPSFTNITKEVCQRLQDFVTDGGGLWIGLGPRTDTERFNQYLFADGSGLAPVAVDRIIDDSEKDQKPTIDPFRTSHPATTSLADSDRLDTGRIAVSQRFRFVSPPAGEDPSILLGLSNGEPLAVEKLVGRGRVIVLAVPLRMIWSDLVRSQAFVVMVQDWLSYLTDPLATRFNLSPGDPIRLFLPGVSARDATLRTPDGEDVELTGRETNGGVEFRTSRTIQPGEYSLEVGISGERIPFLVWGDSKESNLATLTDDDRKLLSETTGLGRQNSGESLKTATPTDAAWPLLLSLLIVLMLAELLLAGNMSRQRFGSEPISETSDALADDLSGLHVGLGRSRSFQTHEKESIHQTRT